MKLFIKLLITLAVFACLVPFFIKDLNGLPIWTSSDFNFSALPSFTEISHESKQIFSSAKPDQTTNPGTFKAYKWVDEKGVVHYSDKNEARYKSQLTEIQDITILPAIKAKSTNQSNLQDSTFSSKLPQLTTVPLQQIPKLIDDAKQAKKMMEERKNTLDEVLNSQTQ